MVQKSHPDRFNVKIIGKQSNPAYSQELESLITPDLENSVQFLGPLYDQAKFDELLSSHVFILPTKNDCFPLSILEAMAARLAVISTTQGAIPDIVDHGVTGEILNETSVEALAASMIRFIEDYSYCDACALSGRKKFELKYTKEIFETSLTLELKRLTTRVYRHRL
ncbi:UDP-D-galactose:(glucosyl)lipopolysaccharide-1,6-D-galactosyltransferase [compost metagenome]